MQQLFQRFCHSFSHRKPAALLIGILLLVFLAQFLTGMSRFESNQQPGMLILLGAQQGKLILEGQWWRFFTAMWIHGGFIHLFANSISLWILGPLISRLLANGFFSTFIGCGLAGTLLSSWVNPNYFSLGASGGIGGIIGIILIHAYKEIDAFSNEDRRALKQVVLPFVIYGLLPKNGIDNLAHIGGFLAGCLFASIRFWIPRLSIPVSVGLLVLGIAEFYFGFGSRYRANEINYQIGDDYRKKREFANAMRYYQIACDLNHAGACANLSFCQSELGLMEAAAISAAKACELKDYIGCYNLACSYFKNPNKKEEAYIYLTKAFQLGFKEWDHLDVDEALSIVRGEPHFVELVQHYKKQQK